VDNAEAPGDYPSGFIQRRRAPGGPPAPAPDDALDDDDLSDFGAFVSCEPRGGAP
jgi:hypothetical protein